MGNHYYNNLGKPTYTVPKTDGTGPRPTTVRDAKKLNLVPSYSTIVSVLNKEGINNWNLGQTMNAAIDWPFINEEYKIDEEYDELVKEWKKQIKEIASKLGKKGRDRGTMVHDALEKCYKGEEIEEELHSLIHPVVELVKHTFGLLPWEAEASFAKDGYGGKVDLHSKRGGGQLWTVYNKICTSLESAIKYQHKVFADNGADPATVDIFNPIKEINRGILIDFKTKDVDDIKKMAPYPEDVMQHAAYRDGLGIPNAECYSLFVNVKHPGMLVLHKWKEEEIQRAKKMFDCLKNFWYLSNKMEEIR